MFHASYIKCPKCGYTYLSPCCYLIPKNGDRRLPVIINWKHPSYPEQSKYPTPFLNLQYNIWSVIESTANLLQLTIHCAPPFIPTPDPTPTPEYTIPVSEKIPMNVPTIIPTVPPALVQVQSVPTVSSIIPLFKFIGCPWDPQGGQLSLSGKTLLRDLFFLSWTLGDMASACSTPVQQQYPNWLSKGISIIYNIQSQVNVKPLKNQALTYQALDY